MAYQENQWRLGSVVLLAAAMLSMRALAADEGRTRSAPADTKTASDQRAESPEPAECPIKKTINGQTYCFQNDPALTKPQGGD